MASLEKELEILKQISNNSDEIRQRDLAEIIGMSLGMTNSILKRLVKKGFLIIKRINNRNIRYAVTAKGMEEITKRSVQYFKRTIKNIAYYRDEIDAIVSEAVKSHEAIVLVGESDLEFIIEHFCFKYGIKFFKDKPKNDKFKCFYVYSENYEKDASVKDFIFLENIIK